jgi:hypothetical protein
VLHVESQIPSDFVGALTLDAGLVSPGSAPASIIAYPLTSGACCGAGPFGTVTVSTVNSTTVDVSVTLAAGEVFANTGALNHEALEFSISSNPTISVAVNTPPTRATQTITASSVMVALVLGAIEALGLVPERLGLTGGIWSVIGFAASNFTALGYLVDGIFVVSWLASLAIYRVMSYDMIGSA